MSIATTFAIGFIAFGHAEVLYQQSVSSGLQNIPLHLNTRAKGNRNLTTGLHVNFWDKAFEGRDQLLNRPLAADIGTLTGFRPASCLTGSCAKAQVGFSSAPGGSAVQADGTEIGVVLDSQSFLNPKSPVGPWPLRSPMPLMIEYNFARSKRPVPFAQPGKILNFKVQLQVPTSETVGDNFNAGASVNLITLYLALFDRKSKRSIAYGAHAWDSRPNWWTDNTSGYVSVDACRPPSTCTWSPMVVAPISSGGKFNRFVRRSSGEVHGAFRGYRQFVHSISAENLSAVVRDLNKIVDRYGQTPLSTDPADYELKGISVDSEIAYAGTPARFAFSARDIAITVEDAPAPVPFVELYDARTDRTRFIPRINALNSVASAQRLGFVTKGSIGSIYTNLDQPGLVPLHQFFRESDQDTFFIKNAGANNFESMSRMGYRFQGVVGYVPANKAATSVRSLYKPGSGHFYCSDPTRLAALQKAGWNPEAVRFELLP